MSAIFCVTYAEKLKFYLKILSNKSYICSLGKFKTKAPHDIVGLIRLIKPFLKTFSNAF